MASLPLPTLSLIEWERVLSRYLAHRAMGEDGPTATIQTKRDLPRIDPQQIERVVADYESLEI